MIMDAVKHYGLGQRINLTQAVNLPLRNTKRIKFTCFDVSHKYLIFGANSGSLYVYDRGTISFLSIIPSQLGRISQLSISRNGKQIAIANMRGSIGIVLDLESSGSSKEVLLTDLGNGNNGNFVTCFCWGEDDRELYCGDSKGTVSLLQLAMFMGRNILNITLNPVLLLENQIVQIDRYQDLLLVSTLSKCVLCNTAREEFKQIGNRPRDGEYGATFIVGQRHRTGTPVEAEEDDNDNNQMPSPSMYCSSTASDIIRREEVRIFCARPGSRLWEADMEGNVLRTHQFKQKSDASPQQNDIISFKRLQTILNRLILVHDSREIFLIDPLASKVVLWINDLEQIERVAVVGEHIYVFGGEQKLFQLKLEVEISSQPKKITSNGKQNSPLRMENGVYILDHLFNNNGGRDGSLQAEVTIKEALVSVVRGKYGRNIKQMFLGYDQIGPERPKTLNVSKMYNNEENYNDIVRILPSNDEAVEDEDTTEEVVPKRNAQKKMFSMSLLSDYQLSEDDKTVRNLYLVYRSSTISNLNFTDRYAKIFDAYECQAIVSLLYKLECVMEEHNEDNPRLKCIRIYFDYLKVELIWEIDEESRVYIKRSFIEYNQKLLDEELRLLEKCESCGHYLRPTSCCHYADIGTTLIQYYWSRREYTQCFEIVQQVPYLWLTITKFHIQDQREDKVVQCLWNVGDRVLLERAASEMFSIDLWRQLLDLMLTCYNSNSLMCLNCDKLCTFVDPDRNPMRLQLSDSDKSNNYATQTSSSSQTNIDQRINFYSWDYILNVAINSEVVEGKDLLQLLRGYDEFIPKGAISTRFYLKCLLDTSE
ncbi:BLOC-2 complex member HPS5 homolog [Topomyia yanbarensis]|uniref:BLOC-2 complex member HPS5 homolog n=1 Tax=Topomyia yanbarensis TaxID=2498891 RepID=UPI00273AD28D|nr:BLOC-2 complex member HPS5 homolog [Topomyia yanbarensis]